MQRDGPDFICIGMPKAGTGWLYDRCASHAGFWMPPVKELHYLDRMRPVMYSATKRLKRFEQMADPSREGIGRKRRFDARDRAFLEAADAASGERMNLDIYASLFRPKGDKLSGDITPRYVSLSDEVITKIGGRFPETRIVVLVRDPVSRALSRISMAYRNGHFDEKVLDDADAFRGVLETADYLRDRSSPTRIVDNWKRCASHVPFRVFFFDDLIAREDHLHLEIMTFLGADCSSLGLGGVTGENRKSKMTKLAFSETATRIVADFFRDELLACKNLGGPAPSWAARYGL